MTDHPMLYSAPMVRGLIREADARWTGKRQTRRLSKDQPPAGVSIIRKTIRPLNAEQYHAFERRTMYDNYGGDVPVRIKRGDRLWVREAWRCNGWATDLATIFYAASEGDGYTAMCEQYPVAGKQPLRITAGWRPSIHMPRWASRLTLTVNDVRIERLQDISETDATAEGIIYENVIIGCHGDTGRHVEITADRYWNGSEPDGFEGHESAVDAYADLWDHINGAGAWESNPWVVAYTFSVQHGNIDQIAKVAA